MHQVTIQFRLRERHLRHYRQRHQTFEVKELDETLYHSFESIRGERPVMDEKYDILKHPNIALTEDGGAAPYEHGGTENAIATLSFAGAAAETLFEFNEPIPDYELLSDEDIEALF